MIILSSVGDKRLIPNRYFINKMGVVMSFKHGIFSVLKPFPDARRGYLKIKLYDIDKNPITVSVHRLVFTSFNKINYYTNGEINHINGVKDDNRLDNLELVTPKENVRHSIINKLSPSRAHQLTLNLAVKIYLEIINTNKTNSELAKKYNYDRKIIAKLRNNTHTLSSEILYFLGI